MTCRFRIGKVAFIGLVTFVEAVTAATASSDASGSIQGILTGQDGHAIKGAKITANLATSAKAVTAPGPTVTGLQQGSAVTNGDGSFHLNKLLPGTYTICAQAAQEAEIDPCHWSQTPPQVTVAVDQAVTGFKISTKKGSVLNVRINDAPRLLQAAATSQGLPHVLVGVYTLSGQFYPAYVTSKDATGVNYSLTIPTNTALRLTVSSKHVKLADSAGVPVPANGLTYPFRHDSSVDNSKPVTFQITGSY